MEPNEISVEEAERIFSELTTETPTEETVTPDPVVPDVPAPSAPEPDNTEVVPPVAEDWLVKIEDATLRERVQAEIQRAQQLEHRIKSDDGRVAAFQRKADELKRELQEMRRQPVVPEQPAGIQGVPEEWKPVIENDPLLAKAVEALIRSEKEALRKEFKETQAAVIKPLEDDRKQQQIEHEIEQLAKHVPDWKELRETEMFKGWLEYEASPILQQAWNSSYNHRDILAVYNAFAVDMIGSGRVSSPAPAEAAHVPAPVDTSRADNIAADRERKLQQTPIASRENVLPHPPASKGPMTVPGGVVSGEDAEALFKSLFK